MRLTDLVYTLEFPLSSISWGRWKRLEITKLVTIVILFRSVLKYIVSMR